MRILNARIHGVIDLVVVVVFLLAPMLVGLGGRPAAISYTLAVVYLVMVLMTRFPMGLWKTIPFFAHGIVELVIGVFLLILPSFDGYSPGSPARRGSTWRWEPSFSSCGRSRPTASATPCPQPRRRPRPACDPPRLGRARVRGLCQLKLKPAATGPGPSSSDSSTRAPSPRSSRWAAPGLRSSGWITTRPRWVFSRDT